MAAGLTNGVSTLAVIVSLLDYRAPRVRQSSPRETEACESPPCGGFRGSWANFDDQLTHYLVVAEVSPTRRQCR